MPQLFDDRFERVVITHALRTPIGKSRRGALRETSSGDMLVAVVRAEFLRARNFDYVRAARALGESNLRIIFRHVLPNAMVATVTFLPFLLTGAITALIARRLAGHRR